MPCSPDWGSCRCSPPTILIRNVHLFDGTGIARRPRNLRILGYRIDAVSAGDIPVPVRGNPLDDLRMLEDFERNLLVIMKDGVVHKKLMPA